MVSAVQTAIPDQQSPQQRFRNQSTRWSSDNRWVQQKVKAAHHDSEMMTPSAAVSTHSAQTHGCYWGCCKYQTRGKHEERTWGL